jgi:hypothetical protein
VEGEHGKSADGGGGDEVRSNIEAASRIPRRIPQLSGRHFADSTVIVADFYGGILFIDCISERKSAACPLHCAILTLLLPSFLLPL